ncbi:speckle-type POZ protein-like [Microplitis mediator]|uniref:speckle-type POZ protein-like n=1 Tax=Microplitis mediator TaxID=375433 RepID=UPI00255419B7|nr:speckle-type POZ protein-like [Microplitis mediator]
MIRGYKALDERNIVYEWKIYNIDSFFNRENELTLYSSLLSWGINSTDTWRIKSIFSSGDDVKFYLMPPTDYVSNIKSSLCVLDNKKEKKFINNYTCSYLEAKEGTLCLSLSKKTLLDNKDIYLPNKTLTICFDLTLYGTPTTTCNKLMNLPKYQMAHDYTELYNTKMGFDTIINVDDKEFQAHKIILMTRSPVLAAMFSHDMIEKKENKISIPDISSGIFEMVLKYIYTDEVTDLDLYADDLLEAADKYQLLSLKNICQESLSESLDLENALYSMNLADRHSAKELLDFTMRFMASNIRNFIETQDFKNLEESNITEACELLKKLSCY